MAKKKTSENLRHFGLWLDRNMDAELISYLTPYADRRRIGELFRNAIACYRGSQGFVPPAPTAAVAPRKMSLPPIAPSLPVATGETATLKAKFRSAFGK